MTKRKKLTPEEREAWRAHSERTLAMLQERIDYWTARVKAADDQSK